MKNSGERETCHTGTQRFILSHAGSHESSKLSFFITDRKDFEILSAAKEGPITVLNMCERTGLSFVECLHRTLRLEKSGFLTRVAGPDSGNGLNRYMSVL